MITKSMPVFDPAGTFAASKPFRFAGREYARGDRFVAPPGADSRRIQQMCDARMIQPVGLAEAKPEPAPKGVKRG